MQRYRSVGRIQEGRASPALRAVDGAAALVVDFVGVPTFFGRNAASADSFPGVALSRVLGALPLPRKSPASFAFPLGVLVLLVGEPEGRMWSRCV